MDPVDMGPGVDASGTDSRVPVTLVRKPRTELASGDVLSTPRDCFKRRLVKRVTQYGHCTYVLFEDRGEYAGGFKTIRTATVLVEVPGV
jgi:hypothetical protein